MTGPVTGPAVPRIRILIVDDQPIVRAGLRALLTHQTDLEVVGEAADGAEVVSECRRLTPDMVLLDLAVPRRGGLTAIHDLRRTCPGVRVLVLTVHEDEAYARHALLAGATGYVLKKGLTTELFAAIRAVQRGEQYVTPTLAQALTAPNGARAPASRNANRLESLTPREREVVSVVALGHTNREIAERLQISTKTVEAHRKNITTKLGLLTRAELVRFALDHGLIRV